MNSVQLVGRITKEVDLKYLQNATAVANFSNAIDREISKAKKEEFAAQGKQTADFIPIVVYGKPAENCAKYLAKGSKVIVQGRITSGSYTNQSGEKKYTMQVTAEKVEFLEISKNNNQNSELQIDNEDHQTDNHVNEE